MEVMVIVEDARAGWVEDDAPPYHVALLEQPAGTTAAISMGSLSILALYKALRVLLIARGFLDKDGTPLKVRPL